MTTPTTDTLRDFVNTFLEHRVKEFNLDGATWDKDTDLFLLGVLDSFAFIELLSEVFDTFSITIDPIDLDAGSMISLESIVTELHRMAQDS
jgi:acyl carrier protein